MPTSLLAVSGLSYRYAGRQALDGVSFEVQEGETFGLLGPNGSGKTTLFRLLSTLLEPQEGSVSLGGLDLARQPAEVRRLLGVVFQSPSLDKKLTVRENLGCQGLLYGLAGAALRRRTDELLGSFGLGERAGDKVETLSGGLARRVEIAKALLHRPRVLLLDEPTTGLDPRARLEMWEALRQARSESPGLTILVTTHLMEDAERCHRLLLLDQGRRVALDTPEALKRSVGGALLLLRSPRPEALASRLRERFSLPATLVDGVLRLEPSDAGKAPRLLADVAEAFGEDIDAITLAHPTLEDVFIRLTGRKLEAFS